MCCAQVHEAMGESEERLVSVTSQEEALAPYCAAQVRVQGGSPLCGRQPACVGFAI